jgi:hypothetical protein
MAGCAPIGYAYPTVSYVPPVTLGAERDEVTAFRVDVADDDNCFNIREKDEYVLHPLPLHRDGHIDPQMKLAVDYGWIWNWVSGIYDGATRHTVMVRLYRPGYRTIEIHSWQKKGRVNWVPASSPEEREIAIDELISTWNTTPERLQNQIARTGFVPPRDPFVFHYLAPGATLDEHQQALQFAAREYERLLRQAASPDMHERLEAKARKLRELAAR